MKKLLCVACLAVSASLIAVPAPESLAGKKAAKGTIELIESKDGKYRFTVRDGEGKYVGGSATGYATEKAAKEAVEDLKKVLETATYVSKKADAPKDK